MYHDMDPMEYVCPIFASQWAFMIRTAVIARSVELPSLVSVHRSPAVLLASDGDIYASDGLGKSDGFARH